MILKLICKTFKWLVRKFGQSCVKGPILQVRHSCLKTVEPRVWLTTCSQRSLLRKASWVLLSTWSARKELQCTSVISHRNREKSSLKQTGRGDQFHFSAWCWIPSDQNNDFKCLKVPFPEAISVRRVRRRRVVCRCRAIAFLFNFIICLFSPQDFAG